MSVISCSLFGQFPVFPEQDDLDRLITVVTTSGDSISADGDAVSRRFTLLADANFATMFYSYLKEEKWYVFPIDLFI